MGFSRLSLKARALRLLAQREHSRSELQAKLARHVEEGEDLPALLDALEAQGLVSAQRVAESVVHQRAARFGARRVAQELRTKGLDEDLVRATAAQLASTELERARAVWRQRFGSAPPPATSQERVRQMRFLAARGFAAEVVRRVVRGGDEEFE